MALTSYNGHVAGKGWSIAGGQLQALVVAGESFSPGVRAGSVGDGLRHIAEFMHRSVEPVYAPGFHAADDWGYAFRLNRNANNLSVHASGGAIDYNATRHPNGRRGTFTAAQAAAIRSFLKGEMRGLYRWGGDYTGTPDEMHLECIGTVGQVQALMQGGGGANLPAPAPSTPQPWLMLPAVRSRPASFQRFYNACPFVPALLPIIKPIANNFGPQSEAALKKVQAFGGTVNGYRCTPLVADGIDGPLTKAKLWSLGWRG